jgi:hypothetical protein
MTTRPRLALLRWPVPRPEERARTQGTIAHVSGIARRGAYIGFEPSFIQPICTTAPACLTCAGTRAGVSGPGEEDDLAGPDLAGIQECGQGAGDSADEATVLRESPG